MSGSVVGIGGSDAVCVGGLFGLAVWIGGFGQWFGLVVMVWIGGLGWWLGLVV